MLKRVGSIMGDMEEEYKLRIVYSITSLFSKYPTSYRVFTTFLSSFFREEGSEVLKSNIVNALIQLSNEVPESLLMNLNHLCEFIEDCEHENIICQVLSHISASILDIPSPSIFIRHITNRIVLENHRVRASAVSAIGKIGVLVPALRITALATLKIAIEDECEEVRDRAVSFINTLSNHLPTVIEDERQEGEEEEEEEEEEDSDDEEVKIEVDEVVEEMLSHLYTDKMPMDWNTLTASLTEYVNVGGVLNNQPMTISSLPIVTPITTTSSSSQSHQLLDGGGVGGGYEEKKMNDPTSINPSSSSSTTSSSSSSVSSISSLLSSTPSLSHLSPHLFSSLPPASLTEDEMEYLVSYQKHVFVSQQEENETKVQMLFHFTISNTIEDQELRDGWIEVEGIDRDGVFNVVGLIKASSVPYPSHLDKKKQRRRSRQASSDQEDGVDPQATAEEEKLKEVKDKTVFLLLELCDGDSPRFLQNY